MRIAPSCIIAVAVVLAGSPHARAQTAEAETLFREGKRLMKKGDIPAACEKLEASEHLEPEIGTELNLGDCREKNGQTASAWAMFIKAAETAKHAGDDERAAEAKKRAHALEDQLVYLTIRVPDDSALDDLVVKRNGEAIDRALWNQRVPIDPDEYKISAEAPNHKTWSETVTVKSKDREIEVPRLVREKKPPHHKEAVAVTPTGPTPRRFRTATIAVGAIALAGLATGTGFAVYADSVESQSDSLCKGQQCTDPHGYDLNKTARTDALIANISWGVGGVAAIGTLALWWIGRPTSGETMSVIPMIGGDRAGLAVGGRF
jgi:serine/threonine-protein kinase